ncbi:MAG: N-acetylmuramoyl-L-alanine amidase, partial [Bacteroidetes bacterium]
MSIIQKLQLFLTLLLIVVGVKGYAQTTIELTYANEPARTTRIKAMQEGKIAYASVNELATGFLLLSKRVAETRQLELQAKEYNICLTPGNPFLSITDSKRSRSLVQLPFGIEQRGAELFAPVESFVDVIDDIIPEEVSYDRTKQRIVVGKLSLPTTYDISKVSFAQKSNGYLLRIFSKKRINDYESWLKEVEDGTWLYITLPETKADLQALNSQKPDGIVKEFLAFQSPTSLQLTFKLNTKVRNTELMQAEGSNDLLVAIHTPVEEELKAAKLEAVLERTRNRWKLDCIVIDAGHGGKDPGTIGVKKTKEKDVTLAIALTLGKLIEQNLNDVKVVYTRKSDEFIELYRRGQIANAAGGKLFISIHCNSTPRKPKPANGFEIYLLRPGKTESAVQIASRENEVVKLESDYQQRYQELTEEQFILVTLAQSAYVKYSELFAEILQGEMRRMLPVKNNGVKQAGFYVLVGASMPNVLIETGYLS